MSDLADQCFCCAPQDPDQEREHELAHNPAKRATPSPRNTTEATLTGSSPSAYSSANRWGADDQDSLLAPVPEAGEDAILVPPPVPSQGPPSTGQGRGGVDLEILVFDLESGETQVYGEAFRRIAPSGHAEPDNQALRHYLLSNSSLISDDNLDTEILKIASESDSFGIDESGFIKLLREHPLENEALSQFMGLSEDGDTIGSGDCRSGLLSLMKDVLNADFDDNQWDLIFDSVMQEAGLTVTMQQYIEFARRVARIIRVSRASRT